MFKPSSFSLLIRHAARAVLLLAAVTLISPPSARAQTPQKQRDLVRAEAALSAVQRRVALVIGNKDYADGPLTNPVNDATAMAETLKDLGFDVLLKTNLTNAQMDDAVDQFAQKLDKNTIGLFYFSGHGVQVGGVNYLVPIGASIHRQSDVKYQAFAAAQVRDTMRQSGCRLSILILDACRTNKLPKGLKDASGGGGLDKMGTPLGVLVAYAASPGETASDDPDKSNGLYTGILLQKMKTPGMKIEDVFKKTRESVLQASGQKQTPMEESVLVDDFYFASASAPTPLPDPISAPAVTAVAGVSATEYIKRGDALWSQQKYDSAASQYTLAIDADSSNAEAFYDRGSAYSRLNQNDKALSDLTEAIRLKPDYADAFLNRSSVYEDIDQHDKALADCTEALRLNPGSAEAHNMRGNIYKSLNLFDKSLADYGEAIRLKPDYAAAFSNRGSIYYSQKQYSKALTDYSEAIRLKPNYNTAYNLRGNTYYSMKMLDKAAADYGEAIRIKPDYAVYFSNRGNVYFEQEQYGKAVADYSEALRLQPDDAAVVYTNRGSAYNSLNQYDKAISDCTAAIRLKPNYHFAYSSRAMAYYRLNLFPQALADYHRRVELSPDDVPEWMAKLIKDLEAKVK